MLINDAGNREEICTIIVNELREYGVKYRRDKKLKNNQDKNVKRRVFNTPLHLLELNDVILVNGGIAQVPRFVSDACQRILEQVSTEGLFRKAGSSVRQKEIKAGIESGKSLGKSHHVIDVANVVKSFFRDLPEALLPPGNIQESLMRCLLCGEKKVEAMLMTCLLLPPLSLNTLAFFMQFLQTVSLHSNLNKMSVENLAIIFTPGIMPLEEIIGQRLNNHVKIIQLLIDNAHNIGIIPEKLALKTQNILGTSSIKSSSTAIQPEKKKKKRRSGSLTRMFNGLRKMVGAFGSTENLDETPEISESGATPCLNKSTKKRKLMDTQVFSSKKKKDVLSLLPDTNAMLSITPMITKEPKKHRLSLGGKRTEKNKTIGNKKSDIQTNQPMERRWSVVGAPWSRKKIQETKSIEINNDNFQQFLSPVVSLPCLTTNILDSTICKRELFTEKSEDCINESIDDDDAELKKDFVKISKSEYESIKERVSAIETRISQEFCHFHESKCNDGQQQQSASDDSLNGPEKVQNKYERALEETDLIGGDTSTTNRLAKRLSRELKIRRSSDNKIMRSPSARKIGTIRRRSRENMTRLSRNQSWHVPSSSRVSLTTQPQIIDTTMTDLSFYPKNNLKRGRPNTVQTGLRHPSPVKKSNALNFDDNQEEEEKWTCANEFFKKEDENVSSTRSSPRLALKSKTNLTPHFVTKIIVGGGINTNGTPMLPPPEIPTRKTPVNSNKTPMLPPRSAIINKALLTPLQENLTGRASIAKLRSQNAGMVMAKAKLFDGLSTDTTENIENKRYSGQNKMTLLARQSTDTLLNNNIVNNTPRRRASKKSPSRMNRRLKLKLMKSSPQTIQQQNINLSPKILFSKQINNCITETCSPTSSDDIINKMKQTKIDDQTPHIRRPLLIKSPKRLIKTPARDNNKIKTPLKATPISLRYSPRLLSINNR